MEQRTASFIIIYETCKRSLQEGMGGPMGVASSWCWVQPVCIATHMHTGDRVAAALISLTIDHSCYIRAAQNKIYISGKEEAAADEEDVGAKHLLYSCSCGSRSRSLRQPYHHTD